MLPTLTLLTIDAIIIAQPQLIHENFFRQTQKERAIATQVNSQLHYQSYQC